MKVEGSIGVVAIAPTGGVTVLIVVTVIQGRVLGRAVR